jgi:hypothetical protein
MRKIIRCALLSSGVLAMTLPMSVAAQSRQGASNTWGSSVTFRSSNDRLAEVVIAERVKRAEEAGVGTTGTTVRGDVVTNNTYTGEVHQDSVSVLNSVNSTAQTVTLGDGTVATVNTTANSTSGTAIQDGDARNTEIQTEDVGINTLDLGL